MVCQGAADFICVRSGVSNQWQGGKGAPGDYKAERGVVGAQFLHQQ